MPAIDDEPKKAVGPLIVGRLLILINARGFLGFFEEIGSWCGRGQGFLWHRRSIVSLLFKLQCGVSNVSGHDCICVRRHMHTVRRSVFGA